MEYFALLLFLLIFILILSGYPVALVLGGLSTIFGLIFLGLDFFLLLPSRFMGVISNYVLIAVPLFVFMGVMFERSGLAERLLQNMALLFGKKPGGLAISTIIVGTLLAASTGIVGATVIAMGLISLPVMLRQGYHKGIATGSIVSAGTLGQIIPPSIVLVLLGSVLNVSVGDLFAGAVIPGLLLVGGYILYIYIQGRLHPEQMPPVRKEDLEGDVSFGSMIRTLIAPLLLIFAVLGSIFAGIASPTEAAAIGALGAMLLTWMEGKFNLTVLKKVMKETVHINAMVFFILLGATTFSLVFRGMGGDGLLTAWIENSSLSPTFFLLLVMLAMFIAGFFIDFIEIIFIMVPVVAPLLVKFGFDLRWIGILIALNLQTSFLTPPFGFALFYLKGVAPEEVRTQDIYRGVIPFLVIQLIILLLAFFFPQMILSMM